METDINDPATLALAPAKRCVQSTVASRLDELESHFENLGVSSRGDTATCLRNLVRHSTNLDRHHLKFPARKLAGVLALLHVNASGSLSITLTTRSLTLRSHPGDTALPGGRFDESDRSVEETALREANEEVGLPLSPSSSLFHLTNLPPYTSKTMLVVIPVVYLITVPAAPILASLTPNPSEVDCIFHLPLKSFLGLQPSVTLHVHGARRDGPRTRSTAPRPLAEDELFEHSYEDLPWIDGCLYRLHSFSAASAPAPVTGLTADIVVSVALISTYGLGEAEEANEAGEGKLGYTRWAEGQMRWCEIVKRAVVSPKEIGILDKRTSED